jgi:hypothetical protein
LEDPGEGLDMDPAGDILIAGIISRISFRLTARAVITPGIQEKKKRK